MEDEFEQLAQSIDSVRLTKIPDGRSVETLIEFNGRIKVDLSGIKQPILLGELEYLAPHITNTSIQTDHFNDSGYLSHYLILECVTISFSGPFEGYFDERDMHDFHMAILKLPKIKTVRFDTSKLNEEQTEQLEVSFKSLGSEIQVEFFESRRKKKVLKRQLSVG